MLNVLKIRLSFANCRFTFFVSFCSFCSNNWCEFVSVLVYSRQQIVGKFQAHIRFNGIINLRLKTLYIRLSIRWTEWMAHETKAKTNRAFHIIILCLKWLLNNWRIAIDITIFVSEFKCERNLFDINPNINGTFFISLHSEMKIYCSTHSAFAEALRLISFLIFGPEHSHLNVLLYSNSTNILQ